MKSLSSQISFISQERKLLFQKVSDNNDSICGTWPAFWTANLNNWPNGGEIDIVEGVNQALTNHVALHTSNGSIVSESVQTGKFDMTNCFAYAANNAGCGGYNPSPFSYGDGFNEMGGGVYVVDWRAEGIRVWSFPRKYIPHDILSGKPTTHGWGVVCPLSIRSSDISSLILISQVRALISLLISILIKLFLI